MTADSADQVRQLVAMGAREDAARVVGWGVDLERFGSADGTVWRTRLGVDTDRPIILSPRQWIPNSNIHLIIEAFAKLLRVCPTPILVLKRTANTPPALEMELEARLASLSALEATRIVGEVPEEQLPGLYAASDITVSVCSSDGTPVSMLEAMASRSALVAGDLPSLREWIRHGDNGILVPVGDVEALAVELRRLVEGCELRKALGHEGRRTVEERADRRRHLESMEQVYRGLVHSRVVGRGA